MMTKDRIHRSTSPDGTEIAGRVAGKGRPLVLVHGLLCDGEIWAPLVPYLTDDFTCYLMDMRGRGKSDASPDQGAAQRVQDVVTFVESIAEPVSLAGHSLGGRIALQAAAQCDRVSAVAAYEPAVPEVLGEADSSDFMAAFGSMGKMAGEGRLSDAAEIFFEHITERDELEEIRQSGLLEQTGENVPVDLRGIQQDSEVAPPPLSTALNRINVPILLLQGSRSVPWFHNCTRYVADHAPKTEVQTIEGAGHFGPVFAASAVATALRDYLNSTRATV